MIVALGDGHEHAGVVVVVLPVLVEDHLCGAGGFVGPPAAGYLLPIFVAPVDEDGQVSPSPADGSVTEGHLYAWLRLAGKGRLEVEELVAKISFVAGVAFVLSQGPVELGWVVATPVIATRSGGYRVKRSWNVLAGWALGEYLDKASFGIQHFYLIGEFLEGYAEAERLSYPYGEEVLPVGARLYSGDDTRFAPFFLSAGAEVS